MKKSIIIDEFYNLQSQIIIEIENTEGKTKIKNQFSKYLNKKMIKIIIINECIF